MSSFLTLEDSIYIANDGNVGIGVTNPSKKFEVVGDIDATTDYNINGTQVLSSTTLGSSVVNSSLTSVGTLSSLNVNGATSFDGTVTLERVNSSTEGGEINLKMSDDSNTWNIDCYGASTAQQDLRLFSSASGNKVKIQSDLEVNGSVTQGATTLKGHIIPDTNDAYDIGSAEFKIRDMYVSDNSLWVGDNHKVSISGGKMKFRKRKTSSVPAAITAAGGNASGALNHSGLGSISSMKLRHWKAYMRTLANQSNATIQDIFRDNTDDYEEEAGVDNWLESGSKTYNTLGNVGVGTSDPAALLHLHHIPEASAGLKELLRLSWDDGNYNTLKGDGTKISFNTSNTNNFPGGEEGGYVGVMKANAVEADTECDFSVGLNNGTSVVERLRILSTGYVGIGNDTPSYKLDVAGDINLTGDLRINGVVQSFGGGSSVWSTNSTNAYYNSGSVGIGTNSPNEIIQLHNTASAPCALHLTNTNTGSGNTDGLKVMVGTWGDVHIQQLEDADLAFHTNGTERMRLMNDGKLGIGDSTPSYKLDVAGDINLTGDLRINGVVQSFGGGSSVWSENGSRATYSGYVTIGNNAEFDGVLTSNVTSSTNTSVILRNGNGQSTFNDGAQVQFSFNGNSNFSHFIHTRHNSADSNNAIDFYVCDGTSSNSVTSGSHHCMSLVSGNVGIGDTTPSYKLDVAGDINLTGDLRINGVAQSFGGGGGSGFNDLTETLTGQYGTVQTTASNGTGSWQGYSIAGRYALMSENNNNVGLYNDIDNKWIMYYKRDSATTGNLRFYAGGNERMRLLHNGSLGLGTTAPEGVKLDCRGKARFDTSQTNPPDNATWGGSGCRIILWPGSSSQPPYAFGINGSTMWYSVPSSAAHRFYVGTSEKVTIKGSNMGIGTNNPSDKLHVYNGQFRLRTTDTTNQDRYMRMRVNEGNMYFWLKNLGKDTFKLGNSGIHQVYTQHGSTGVPCMQFFKGKAGSTNNELLRFYQGSSGGLNTGTDEGSIELNGSSNLAFANHSDGRLKENIVDYENGYNKVKQLRTVEFEWKDAQKKEEVGRIIGFIAQEAKEVITKSVSKRYNYSGLEDEEFDEEDFIYTMSHTELIPFNWSATRTLINKVEALEAENASLKEDLALIKAHLGL